MKSWITDLMKKRGRIYLLPTKMGGYFNGLIFLMFLLSVGYNNNLLLIFTLFLFAFNLIWVVQTHFHLHGFVPEKVLIMDGHSDEEIPYTIFWKKEILNSFAPSLNLISDKGRIQLKSLEQQRDRTVGELVLSQRGIWKWSYLLISTEKPFGLYRAWKYVKINQATLAYPALLKDSAPPLLTGLEGEGEQSTGGKGEEDYFTLSQYDGGGTRKISWKHYARTGEVLIKEGEELKAPEAYFRLPHISDINLEVLLSDLATKMVKCHQQEILFSLESVKGVKGPAHHTSHLNECLKELSLC